MKRIGLYLFIIGITFIKAYGQEDSGPVNTGAANYLTIPVDARSAAMGGAGVAISRVNNAVSIMVRQLYRRPCTKVGLRILIPRGCVTMSLDTLFIV